jgi:abequosyltransferase
MSNIRLSICISTLNRARFIGITLESIVSNPTAETEIIIVDSSSDAETEDVVKGFEERFQHIKYFRVDQRFGMDEKYSKAVELARGQYCWLFTDDDVLKPGAVSAVLEATRKNYSLILVNAEVRNPDLTLCLEVKRFAFEEDRVYPPTTPERDHLLADLGQYLTFIGAVVIRREVWNEREKQKYFGTLFVHLGVIFQSPLPNDTLFVAYPWIVIRYGLAQWRPRSFEIWMFMFPDLIWSFPDFSDWAKLKVTTREPWRQWRGLVLLRAMGHYSIKEYRDFLKPRLKPSLLNAWAGVVAVTPIRPINFLARVRTRLRGQVPSVKWFDLHAQLSQIKAR